ncbi:MAG TPA: glycosyl hydrolase family 18 protein, partial [Candidatus Paceibacterota bacterium]|nr:glycosyl hydrolase family 18 protein [Candidatus Paceibacterota bacterium]
DARTLTAGLSGSDVTALQTQLIAKGYLSASATGYFGPATLAAVKKFQCAQGIVCSGSSYGIAGPKTQAALSGAGAATVDTSTSVGASTAQAPAGVVAGVDPNQQGVLTGKSLTAKYTGPLEFSGWVPDWRADAAAADTTAHLSQLNSIMPFGYKVNGNGQIAGDFQATIEPWASLIKAAKAKGVRVIPSVEWGDGPTIQAILSNTTKRIALEDEIANLVAANGFDGIDIDFEAKQSATRDYFSTFLKGLYARIGNKFVYCTIESRQPLIDRYLPDETIPADALDYANDYSAMNKYCDRVEIMAYDQGVVNHRLNNARSAPYAPVADPGWTGDLIQLAAQSIAKNKIILGVPTYGYEYSVTPKSGGGFDYQVQWAFNPKYATDLATQLGITPHRTSANELGFTYDPSKISDQPTGGETTETQQDPTEGTVQNAGSQVGTNKTFNYVTWSDAQAIKDKVDQAREYGIRGVAVFSLGGAEDPAMWSILK